METRKLNLEEMAMIKGEQFSGHDISCALTNIGIGIATGLGDGKIIN